MTHVAAPGLGCGQADRRVGVEQPPVIGAQNVVAFRFGQRRDEGPPGFGKHRAQPVEEPADLLRPAEEDPAQDQTETALGVSLGVGQGQGAAPGAAEQEPAVDAERSAQPLHVGDQMVGGVVLERAARRRATGAPLIEDDDTVEGGIEEPPMRRDRPGAGAAMQEHDRGAVGVAALFPIHRVGVVEPHTAGLVGLYGRVQLLAYHGVTAPPRDARAGRTSRSRIVLTVGTAGAHDETREV